MDLKLKDKIAIVTGASRGIGRAIACRLSGEGMKVVLVARTRDQLEEAAQVCGTEYLIESADLSEPDAARTVVESTVRRFGAIDLLVNNAGATQRGDFLKLDDRDWEAGFGLKFFGAMRLSRAAWPYLTDRKGNLIFISGIGGRTGSAEFTIGGSVNAALLNLTKALADRGSADGVRVNAVNPSAIMTERLRRRIRAVAAESGIDEAEAATELSRKLGVSRFGKPDEVASVVAFLASSAASYCHGTIFDVDGGKTLTL